MTVSLRRYIRQFRNDQNGSMAIELLLVVPIMTWVLMSTFVYFDLYRNEANTHRAALTIADMFSREQTSVDGVYMNSARELLRTLTLDDDNPDLRVTVYRYDEDDDLYYLVWSENRDMAPNLDDNILRDLQIAQRLPILAHNDRAILVETRATYTAPFSTGIGQFSDTDLDEVTFTTFTVIRPRFNPTLCWDRPDPLSDLC